MQSILLINLKVSTDSEMELHENCGKSEAFPGYTYFIGAEEKAYISSKALTNVTGLEGQEWMLGVVGVRTMTDFENFLCEGFDDIRAVLTRLLTIADKGNIDTLDTGWIEAEHEDKPLAIPKTINTVELPDLSNNEIISLAEYDELLELFAGEYNNTDMRKKLILSVLETMCALTENPMHNYKTIMNVFYPNLLLSITQAKNADPDMACQFMSYVAKSVMTKLAKMREEE